MIRTFDSVGGALVTTSIILFGGFGVLVLSPKPVVRLFGGLCCLAIAMALICDFVVLPSLLTLSYGGTDGYKRGRCAIIRFVSGAHGCDVSAPEHQDANPTHTLITLAGYPVKLGRLARGEYVEIELRGYRMTWYSVWVIPWPPLCAAQP